MRYKGVKIGRRSRVSFARRLTVRLIRNLGHAVLIEGVETEEQLTALKRMDVRWIQGFLKGRPVPIEKAGQIADRQSPALSLAERSA